MKLTKNNYHYYYAVKDGKYYEIVHLHNYRYGLIDICKTNIEFLRGHLQSWDAEDDGTFEYIVNKIKTDNYKLIKREDFYNIDNSIILSPTQENFLNNIMDVLINNENTTHYCKNLARSIKQSIK